MSAPAPPARIGFVRFAILILAAAGCFDDRHPTASSLAEGTAFSVEEETPGTGEGRTEVTLGSIIPIVSEQGMVSLSVDAAGTTLPLMTIQVEKPAGATVRSAYLAAASTGFSRRRLNDGDVLLNGTALAWGISTPSSIASWNHWADVTAVVKPPVDAAPTGRVDLTVEEVGSFGIDGVILAVIFDDPNVTTENTVVLLFGAQDILGDRFFVNLADPIDTADPELVLDMSLGISFGFQPGPQVSLVDVNGSRLTSCAGGQDDGVAANGGLITAGGLDDTRANPAPTCTAVAGPRSDDELYSLLPFVQDGDTEIEVFTTNPSRDDNILFAAFFLTVEATVTPEPDPNNRPVAAAGGPYTANEGDPVAFDGTASFDADGEPITHDWTFGDGGTASGPTPTHTYADNGVYDVVLTVSDDEPSSDTDATTATILNVAPDLAPLTGPPAPVQVGWQVTISGDFTDPGILDTHTVEYDWGDGTSSSGSVSETDGSGSIDATHVYAQPGVYVVRATVTDKDGDSDTEVFEYVVVYDPDGGFVTGGGWIDSPAGAYPADPGLTGKATFGFVSKYKRGQSTPSGNTQFQFHAAGLNFHSTAYDWLVVAGARAQYKGLGTVNGVAGYAFILTAIDAGQPGGGAEDRLRLRIWSVADDTVIYDNQIGADDLADPTTILGGGSIVIHNGR